jgi:hypothetical protein
MRAKQAAITVATLYAAACSRDRPSGLPEATQWQVPGAGSSEQPLDLSARVGGMGGMGGAAMRGHGGTTDPHAGVLGAPPLGDHNGGGGGGGPDVTQLGLQSPDPNRAIDPSRKIAGTVALTAAVASKAQPGSVLFLMVRVSGPDGMPGAMVAASKLDWTGAGQAFELTERDAMVAGAPDMVGELWLSARVDQDGDASSKQPGDVVGQTKVKAPATGVVLTLDSSIP